MHLRAPFILPVLGSVAVWLCHAAVAQEVKKTPGAEVSKKDSGAKAPQSSTPKPRKIKLHMVDGLRFDPVRISAKTGERLVLELENEDSSHQPHNLVVVRPGTTQEVVQQALALGEQGPGKGFVPTHPAIVAATRGVVDPEKSTTLEFSVPEEPGVYGYVCTVPGHGMIMYGALYAGVPMPLLAKDTHIPQLTVEKGLVGGGRRPFVQRMFVPDSGPASIAVALPGAQNFVFDAGECRVRYAWRGPFMDAAAHWRGNGSALAVLGDAPWWVSDEFPLQVSGRRKPAARKFLGYKLVNGIPEFHYRWSEHEVFESVHPLAEGLEFRYRMPNLKQPIVFSITGSGCAWSSPQGKTLPGRIEINPVRNGEFSVVVVPDEPAVPLGIPTRQEAPAKPSK